MNEKDLESSKESILDFEEAKDLTVGQVKRKNEEVRTLKKLQKSRTRLMFLLI